MSTKPRIPLLVGICLMIGALIFSILPHQAVTAQKAESILSYTFKPSADAYISNAYPTTNYGTNAALRIDVSPVTYSYLRFVVSGLSGTVQSAKLRLYANSSNTTGYTVYSESNNTWAETTLAFSNAPALGTALRTSGAITAGQWIEADLTSYVKAAGTYNMALVTSSSTNTSFASREAGANAPQLVVTTSTTTTAPTPTASAGLTKVNLTKGPYLMYTGANTAMKIFWQHTSNTTFRVDWGTSAAYGVSSPAVSAYDATNHLYSYNITGLTPGVKYYYRVVVGSQYSAGSFYAAPAATATTLKFVSYGDNRSNPSIQNTVAGQVDKLFQADPGYQTINAVVGDLTSAGDTDSNWTSQMFSSSLTNIRTEMANLSYLPVMGNHEGTGGLFKRYFPMPFVGGRYWSFDYGPAHFIMMDQYTSYSAGSAQYNWLKSDLAATTKKWKIVVLHEPGWTAGGGHTDNTTIQSTYEPLFEQYKVALVLGGHNHYYARASVNGIEHLTIGTGGAPLYAPASGQPKIVKTYQGNGYARFDINGSTLNAWFINTAGSIIDSYTITR